jgi:hypothetical protein
VLSPDTNPFLEIRREHKAPRGLFAAALGITYFELFTIEKGVPAEPSQKIMDGLAALGYQTDGIEQRYKDWRARQIDTVRSSIRDSART